MENEKVAPLLRKIANADQIVRDAQVLFAELERRTLPGISVRFESIKLPMEESYAFDIALFPLLMESVESSVSAETFANLSEMAKLQARVVKALCDRHTAEMQLFLRYGIVCNRAIALPRNGEQGVYSGLPDQG